ncbi:putative membrane protein [Cryobacterium sp. MP_3.1]|uniref:DoxX family protein n=1 Tax=Cryobacterium sp. MP_3.1 TaxID=3071711 RepID=UPI002DFB8D7A|nr:putative membrane protein [Cryobacterium sp. MP_3.1]
MTLLASQKTRATIVRTVLRLVLGAFLLLAGISHLTVNREAFLAQVPTWLPLEGDFVVVASGVVEIILGAALLALGRFRVQVGWIVAAFFVAIFPGNISQLVTQTDSFGLNTDLDRTIRLLFQPVLVLWALWSTGAWKAWREYRTGRRTDGGN